MRSASKDMTLSVIYHPFKKNTGIRRKKQKSLILPNLQTQTNYIASFLFSLLATIIMFGPSQAEPFSGGSGHKQKPCKESRAILLISNQVWDGRAIFLRPG